MSFKLVQGKTKFIFMPVTASTAIAEGALVAKSSGLLIAATSSTDAAGADIMGVLRKAIVATDDDFAVSARLVPVEVPVERNCLWSFTCGASLVIGDCDNEVDLTDSVTVNRSATSIKVVRPLQVISTTKGVGLVKILGSY